MALLRGMPGAGADLIEIGMPFTDPMADGPTIQAAGRRGLKAGAKVAGVLAMVRDFRAEDRATPIVLMGYLNPILSYGPERFCVDAAAAGVDGLIIVDLPTEEADLLLPHIQRARPRPDPPRRADDRRCAPKPCARRQFGLRLLRQHHRHHRHPHRQRRAPRDRHPTHPPRDRPADRGRLRRALPGAGGHRGRRGRCRRGRLGADRHAGGQPG